MCVYMYTYIYKYIYSAKGLYETLFHCSCTFQQYITTTLSKRKNIFSYVKSILICKIHIVGIWGWVRVPKYFF